MSGLFNQFVFSFGAFLLVIGAVAGWLFRISPAPLAIKLVIPAALVALACYTPWHVRALMGFPVETDFASLPARAELVSFLAFDDDKLVDLWLRVGSERPRAYEVILDDSLKKILRQAGQEQEQGNRVMLRKGKPGKPSQGYIDIDGGKAPYELDPNAFSLPPKGAQQ